jgi:hypothetical protein
VSSKQAEKRGVGGSRRGKRLGRNPHFEKSAFDSFQHREKPSLQHWFATV